MDNDHCRICLTWLGECLDEIDVSSLSLFKRVDGVAIHEKLEFVAGLMVNIFSLIVLKKK